MLNTQRWTGVLLLLVLGLSLGAQEAADDAGNTSRPNESEILFDQEAEEFAEDLPSEQQPSLPGIGIADFLRMIVVLALVIAMIYGFVWLLRRLSHGKPQTGEAIRLLSSKSLKGDAALHVVEVGQRVFLIGSGGNSVNLLTEIDDSESLGEIRLKASQDQEPVSGSFSKILRERLGRKETEPESGENTTDPGAYLRQQRERLKDL
ncbi:MAG: flagellar biosynthetic protein FliO [Spirochaetales bacterium]|nr:flagellar biosynthetic protein FliO [Spirochaetales bacterium]